ncbi:HAUS augmin-like complex subunit 1 isoform X1 [Brienomyrus brachyistius]|uniref:HAUS augmin-like complex subunit 1 isoform X1 n=1 Tax=Brienomyrus brachyistius TaxID=42636 RepID=UPI0020B22368|nr:HAUS augmin-like complex subunit 1 isoform X1 [Brienomyrus brachyistius]
MCEKITKVMQSLTKLVGDQPIPEYEVNTKTIDILYQLAENSDARCNQVSLLIEDHKQKAVEYHAESCHLQDVLLQGAGLSSGSLSKLASDNMATLNSCAMTLKLKDTSLTSFVPAINDLTSRLMEAEKKNRDMERELTTLRKKLGAILVLRKILQEDLSKTAKAQEVENAKAEERLLNMDFIKAKSKDLSFTIKMTEEKIASRKMDYSLTHQAILEVSEDIAKLKQEILPLQKKLKSFRDLTPSPSLAQVKIEEAKRELAVIDAELEMKVDIVNLTTK